MAENMTKGKGPDPVTRQRQKWFDIHGDEKKLLAYAVVLMFLIRVAALVMNNFAETAFLKRFGVAYLPFMFIVNPLITLAVLGRLSLLSARVNAYKQLEGLLLVCLAGALGAWVAMFGTSGLVYPLLYVMKVQFETLLSVFFWNLANELFNFHQSKRLFPLITAGGVLGDMTGNLATMGLSRIMMINHMVPVYAGVLAGALILTRRMDRWVPLQVVPEKTVTGSKKTPPLKQGFSRLNEMIRRYPLVGVMAGFTFLANAVLPILNFQFNVAVDSHFVSEDNLIFFFGSFRAVMNLLSIALLFFSGRFYMRWGIPAALLFHPVNYVLVFLAFFLRFDLISALYARLSTNLFRTTFNQPVTHMLIGIFPDEIRSKVRPLLRGVVARMGLMTGSILVLLLSPVLSPRQLSLAALPFAAVWVGLVFFFRARYFSMIIGFLSAKTLDLDAAGGLKLQEMLKGETLTSEMVAGFKRATGEDAVNLARILRHLNLDGLDDLILQTLSDQDKETMVRLLPLLSDGCGERIFHVLAPHVDVSNERLTLAMIRAVKVNNTPACRHFYHTLNRQCRWDQSDSCGFPEVRAYSDACRLLQDHPHPAPAIESALKSDDEERIQAAVIAADALESREHLPALTRLIKGAPSGRVLPVLIRALGKLDPDHISGLAAPFLGHQEPAVRLVALEQVERIDDDDLKRAVIALVGDGDDAIRRLAIRRIKGCACCNGRMLFEFLHPSSRRMREGIFEIFNALEIKSFYLFAFVENEIQKAGLCLAVSKTLERLPSSPSKTLLMQHLEQMRSAHVKTAVHVASARDDSGRMRIIARHLFSRDHRLRANALEALQGTMHSLLARQITPFLDGSEPEKILTEQRRFLRLPDFVTDLERTIDYLRQKDSVTSRLVRACTPILERKEEGMTLSFQDKMLLIQKVRIFADLAINDLAAICDISEEVVFEAGEVLFHEQTAAETLYICVDGSVTASRNHMDVGRFKAGDIFGMSAFLVDKKRLLTCRADTTTRLLAIHKQEFEELLLAYPQIALEIARIHARMIQRLLAHIREDQGHDRLMKDFFNTEDLK